MDQKRAAPTTDAGRIATELMDARAAYQRALELVDLKVHNKQNTIQEGVALKTEIIKKFEPKFRNLAKLLVSMEDTAD